MQFTGSFEELRIWTVINGGISSVSVRLITKHVSACPRPYPSPPSAALISIQSECWELQQWWGQCRWMGSLPSTAWQHALYVSLHTVGNLLRWEVKWRWMAMGRPCTLPSWKYKSGGSCWWRPAPFYLLFFSLFFFEEAIQEFNPQNIISLPSSCEQNGQHSSLTRRKEGREDEEENTILFRRSTSAFCDNPNPLL